MEETYHCCLRCAAQQYCSADVADGSKAPFCSTTDDFRSSLKSRPFHAPSACLKGVICRHLKFRAHDRKPRGIARKRRDRHHSLNVGSMHPPQTQGKVQSAVRLALSGMYLLQASARTGLIDYQMTSKVPEEFILPIMTGLER